MNRMALWTGISLLMVGASATAEIYRWVDADGKVHYSDRPVQGSQEVQVLVPGDVAPAPAPVSQPTSPDTNPAKPDAAKADTPPADADAAAQVQAQLCKDAQLRLSSYENADSIYEEGPEGRRALSLDERVSTILKARQVVKETCIPPPS